MSVTLIAAASYSLLCFFRPALLCSALVALTPPPPPFPHSSSNQLTDSVWASVEAPSLSSLGEDESPPLATLNGWDRFRSYWNTNPASGISRHLFDSCGVSSR